MLGSWVFRNFPLGWMGIVTYSGDVFSSCWFFKRLKEHSQVLYPSYTLILCEELENRSCPQLPPIMKDGKCGSPAHNLLIEKHLRKRGCWTFRIVGSQGRSFLDGLSWNIMKNTIALASKKSKPPEPSKKTGDREWLTLKVVTLDILACQEEGSSAMKNFSNCITKDSAITK